MTISLPGLCMWHILLFYLYSKSNPLLNLINGGGVTVTVFCVSFCVSLSVAQSTHAHSLFWLNAECKHLLCLNAFCEVQTTTKLPDHALLRR